MSVKQSAVDDPRTYLPAAGHNWALPLYDPLVRLIGGDRVRAALLEQASIGAGQRILDIGCGTGTLATLLTSRYAGVEVTGIDPDPQALARARRKAARAGARIRFDQGFADALPYPDEAFDRVLSSFMFHHVPAGEKRRTLTEALRVLTRDGSLHMVDFAGADSASHGSLARLLHSSHRLADNSESHVLGLMRDAGFPRVRVVRKDAMLFGRIRVVYYEASAR